MVHFRRRYLPGILTTSAVAILPFAVVAFVAYPKRNYPTTSAVHNRSPFNQDIVVSRQSSFALLAAGSSGVTTTATSSLSKFEILEEVGSGSYGTVHLVRDEGDTYVGKRAWNEEDLKILQPFAEQNDDRAQRCRVYWEAEAHCFEKLKKAKATSGLPCLRKIRTDKDGLKWMVFDMIAKPGDISAPALSLQEVMKQDRDDHREDSTHHLYLLSKALGIEPEQPSSSYIARSDEDSDDTVMVAKTLDVVFEELLSILSQIHEHSIVHRDLKPANVLISRDSDGAGKLFLIDFGSAADLDTAGLLRKNIGLSERVAISPIYAAPEIFIETSQLQSALRFDCFSLALLICQLLFQYLDERTDAGFHQQLQAAKWDLNTWLATELAGKVRPAGMDTALQVLDMRPGLWALLQDMLQQDPWDRVDSKTALTRLKKIPKHTSFDEIDQSLTATMDGQFLADVLESMEYCIVPEEYSLTARPLQFVATFRRQEPLGLLLAEPEYVDAQEEFEAETMRLQWQRATANALSGEVYVKGTVPGGQAEALGIFELGDRIQGVGELPVGNQGFDRVVQMIRKDSSPDPKYITLHFDRKSYAASAPSFQSLEGGEVTRSGIFRRSDAERAELTSDKTMLTKEKQNTESPMYLMEKSIYVRDQGAWSSKGRRKSNEDRFVLHELYHSTDGSIILAGVLDGHLGTAASAAVAEELPVILSEELRMRLSSPRKNGMPQTQAAGIEALLESSWNKVCESYRNQCGLNENEGCRIADFDARDGVLDAKTSSSDGFAGTTANLVALDERTGRLAILNCGDSRSFVVGEKDIVFESVDHKPDRELNRFRQAQKDDPSSLYQTPRCRFSRWYVPVGDYEYAVSRSLEGPFATARGIVSDADISIFPAKPGSTIVIATDGLWEIMDTAQVANSVKEMRFKFGKSAADTAKALCSLAIERGSSDNVSAVIIFLD